MQDHLEPSLVAHLLGLLLYQGYAAYQEDSLVQVHVQVQIQIKTTEPTLVPPTSCALISLINMTATKVFPLPVPKYTIVFPTRAFSSSSCW